MNFEEMQMVWDSQSEQTMYAIDRDSLQRLVDRDARAITFDLKILELTAIVTLLFLGGATLIDTFFNGDEYFQLLGVGFDFLAAGFLFWRRRKRESGLTDDPRSLLDRVDLAINRSRATIQSGRDLSTVFSVFAIYGVCIRIAIYGWDGSQWKLVAAVLAVVLLFVCFKMSEQRIHQPRLKNLDALRKKLLDV